MFLSNRDILWARECGKLIVEPGPDHFQAGYDETSIDLHLDRISDTAKVWDIEAFRRTAQARGATGSAELQLGTFDWEQVAGEYLIPVPDTKEQVGTPTVDARTATARRHPELICFVNAKSTKARTALLVHFTAPTVHAGWAGHITLEITNLGPFHFVLRENDAIAQLTVATISSAPDLALKKKKSQTQNQVDPTGAPPKRRKPRRKKGPGKGEGA